MEDILSAEDAMEHNKPERLHVLLVILRELICFIPFYIFIIAAVGYFGFYQTVMGAVFPALLTVIAPLVVPLFIILGTHFELYEIIIMVCFALMIIFLIIFMVLMYCMIIIDYVFSDNTEKKPELFRKVFSGRNMLIFLLAVAVVVSGISYYMKREKTSDMIQSENTGRVLYGSTYSEIRDLDPSAPRTDEENYYVGCAVVNSHRANFNDDVVTESVILSFHDNRDHTGIRESTYYIYPGNIEFTFYPKEKTHITADDVSLEKKDDGFYVTIRFSENDIRTQRFGYNMIDRGQGCEA